MLFETEYFQFWLKVWSFWSNFDHFDDPICYILCHNALTPIFFMNPNHFSYFAGKQMMLGKYSGGMTFQAEGVNLLYHPP